MAGAFRAEMAGGDEIAVRFLERKGASATASGLLDALDSVDIPPGRGTSMSPESTCGG